MFSLDTETTGVDFYHGAKPFFVTVCHGDGRQQWWEWDVDPITREPRIPSEDLEEIRSLLASIHSWGKWLDEEVRERYAIVLQNAKFDAAALATIGLDSWPWRMTHDTLYLGHLLASNQPHDLTSLALHYLGVDIQPYDTALEEATKEARRMIQQAKLRISRREKKAPPVSLVKSAGKIAQTLFGDFLEEPDEPLAHYRIASVDDPQMPSAKKKSWKLDGWLPRTLAVELGYPETHSWHTVLRDYANADSAVTIALWPVLSREAKKRGLWKIYQERRRLLPIVYGMESRGVTLNRLRLKNLSEKYCQESVESSNVMIGIAAERGYALELPKGAVNKSLRTFCFDVLDLPRVYNPKAKTSEPCMDAKLAIPAWLDGTQKGSDQRKFVESLIQKRARDTGVAYMEGYQRFWQPLNNKVQDFRKVVNRSRGDESLHEWYVIHPSLNPTGTDTLRWSSSNPNEQNISKREGFNLRYCFGPAPGREWWALDYQNLELRIPAFEAGEKDAIYVFEHPDDPPYYGSYHLLVADLLHPEDFRKHGKAFKDVFEVTKYKQVKFGNFSIIYGAQEETADRAYGVQGAFRMVRNRFPKIAELSDRQIALAHKLGYVETIPDRRVDPQRGYPLMCARTEWGRPSPTVPLNYHVQSTAMWLTARAMVECQIYLDELTQQDERGYYLCLQVHDEIVFDLPAGVGVEPWTTNLEHVEELARRMAACGDDIGVPTPVTAKYHLDNWSEGRGIPLGGKEGTKEKTRLK